MSVLDRAPGHVIAAGAGEPLTHLGVAWQVLVSSETSAGSLLMARSRFPEGSAPPVHLHHDEDETWYVLSGAVRFHLDDQAREVGPGSAVWGPRGQAHTFEVLEDGSEILVVVTGGANFESFLRATAGDPPPSVDDLLGEMARARIDFLAPPPH